MAGAITFTYGTTNKTNAKSAKSFRMAWTSDASGNVSGLPTRKINGKIRQLVTIPGAGGLAPTTLYDITLLDSDGRDVLAGVGANRSATLPEASAIIEQIVDDSALTLVVSAAGNAKQGTAVVYYD